MEENILLSDKEREVEILNQQVTHIRSQVIMLLKKIRRILDEEPKRKNFDKKMVEVRSLLCSSDPELRRIDPEMTKYVKLMFQYGLHKEKKRKEKIKKAKTKVSKYEESKKREIEQLMEELENLKKENIEIMIEKAKNAKNRINKEIPRIQYVEKRKNSFVKVMSPEIRMRKRIKRFNFSETNLQNQKIRRKNKKRGAMKVKRVFDSQRKRLRNKVNQFVQRKTNKKLMLKGIEVERSPRIKTSLPPFTTPINLTEKRKKEYQTFIETPFEKWKYIESNHNGRKSFFCKSKFNCRQFNDEEKTSKYT